MLPPLSNSPGRTIILREFGAFQSLPEEMDLAGFKAYLFRIWEQRKDFYEESFTEPFSGEVTDALQSQGQAFFQFDGREIRARNYAGFIQYDKCTILILPKLFNVGAVDPDIVFAHLYFYLSYCQAAHFPFQWTEAQPIHSDYLLHPFVRIFARHASFTLSSHPFYAYETVKEAGPFVKGRLAIREYIQEQLSTGQWQQVHNEHSPFRFDNRYNQVIRYVATLLKPLASAGDLATLQGVMQLLEGVSDVPCTVSDCDQSQSVNLTESQYQLLAMCRWFLAVMLGSKPGSHRPTFSFLVPMERVFEDFVAGFIGRHFPVWQAQRQNATFLGTTGGRPTGLIRNDLWLPKHKVVIDSKYKLIAPENAQMPAEDLYQMLAYAVARNASRVHVLYPATDFTPNESIQIQISPIGRPPITILMHFILLTLPQRTETASTAFSELTQHLQEKLQEAIIF